MHAFAIVKLTENNDKYYFYNDDEYVYERNLDMIFGAPRLLFYRLYIAIN